jgi:ligand-binding SRPBCC domain-containing protein
VRPSYSFALSTALAASPEKVWAHASTFAGVNRELWPWARMTYPPSHARLTRRAFPSGQTTFRSWILLLGFLPVEFDDFHLAEIVEGRGFLEVSRLFSMKEWRHRRTIDAVLGGCLVRDVVSFEPRWRLAGSVLYRTYRLAFGLRHGALKRLFGGL